MHNSFATVPWIHSDQSKSQIDGTHPLCIFSEFCNLHYVSIHSRDPYPRFQIPSESDQYPDGNMESQYQDGHYKVSYDLPLSSFFLFWVSSPIKLPISQNSWSPVSPH